jgi:hypothetical protein
MHLYAAFRFVVPNCGLVRLRRHLIQLALLRVELFGIYFGGESALRLAVEAGDGARYRMCFLGAL